MNLIKTNNQYTIEYTMKTLLSFLFFTFLFVGCMDNPSDLTSPDAQINQQSNSPNWIELPETEGMSVENQFSVTEYIDIEHGGELIINESYSGGPHGEVKVIAKFKIYENTVPEPLLVTMTVDNETGAIAFSPSTIFNRSSELYVKFEGLDLSNVDPDNVQFIDQTPDNNVYSVQYESLDVDISSGIIELKVEPFIVDYSQISYNVMEIGGARYAFVR